MKKHVLAGTLAVALIAVGGTGAYLSTAKADSVDPGTFMQQEGVTPEKMAQVMNGTEIQEMQKLMQSGNAGFEQMLPFMKKAHPNLGKQQLEDLYDNMQTTGGPAGCNDVMRSSGQFNK